MSVKDDKNFSVYWVKYIITYTITSLDFRWPGEHKKFRNGLISIGVPPRNTIKIGGKLI